jgi:hypothetical protein
MHHAEEDHLVISFNSEITVDCTLDASRPTADALHNNLPLLDPPLFYDGNVDTPGTVDGL